MYAIENQHGYVRHNGTKKELVSDLNEMIKDGKIITRIVNNGNDSVFIEFVNILRK